MSFLDEPEEPQPRAPRQAPPRGPGTDAQTVALRRVVAAVAGIVVILILFFGIRACASAARGQAFQDYAADTGALVSESNQQGSSLFGLLENPGGQTAVDIQNTINGLRVEAEQLVERARAVKTPSQLADAQRYLEEALGFRADGLRGVAEQLPAAIGDQGHRDAAIAIAGQMQNFLASDVIYSQRFVARVQEAAHAANVLDRIGTLPQSQFLPDVKWLDEKTVTDAITAIRSGGTNASNQPASPGLHGTGLEGVTVKPGGEALTDGGVTSIQNSSNLAFAVDVQNQGESDEHNVPIKISIAGGNSPIELSGSIPTIKQGETVTAEIPLGSQQLPTGATLTASVEVGGVPGEKSLDNNKAKYQLSVQ